MSNQRRGSYRGSSRRTSEKPPQEPERIIPDKSIEDIITKGNPDELIAQAEKLGEVLKNKQLKTASVRNFFGMVRQMQSHETIRRREMGKQDEISDATHRDLILMIPKLRYQAQRLDGVDTLARELEPAIKAVGNDPKAFSNFVDFFEAILAYHKAAGGAEQ